MSTSINTNTSKVYIDEKLKSYVVPTELRDNSATVLGNVFTAGTRIPLDVSTKYIRMFTAWGGKHSSLIFDIDVSAGFM